MKTTFPYLAIARRRRVDYGDVLRYAQFIDRLRGFPDRLRERDSWQRDVARAWEAEQKRRQKK